MSFLAILFLLHFHNLSFGLVHLYLLRMSKQSKILSLILSSIGSFPLLMITVFLIISFLVCYMSILTFPYFPPSFFLYRKFIFLLLAGLLPNIGLLILIDFNEKRISTFWKLKFVKQVHTFYKNFVFLEDFYIQNF